MTLKGRDWKSDNIVNQSKMMTMMQATINEHKLSQPADQQLPCDML